MRACNGMQTCTSLVKYFIVAEVGHGTVQYKQTHFLGVPRQLGRNEEQSREAVPVD